MDFPASRCHRAIVGLGLTLLNLQSVHSLAVASRCIAPLFCRYRTASFVGICAIQEAMGDFVVVLSILKFWYPLLLVGRRPDAPNSVAAP